ncbi:MULTISPECIES: FAD-dependent monooxygenase [unclassified Legionella]|uniref:FAD-dependent monooxygenase n=1 Tax=unclassified Legionella TaxID=2622702 RepID=UPI0010569488|nr:MULTISPECIES: FAD-dependent monooxygenase [unclassified Legionella]MDI9818112.1 FAD-dependent monooxygenase [Legionella sp. PL877]
MSNYPILIVGAGPTGLTLANQLSRYNIPYRIIDKNETVSPLSRALVIHARTLEVLSDIGLIEQFLESGNKIRGVKFYFNKKQTVYLNYQLAESIYNFALAIPQATTEMLLENFLLNKYGVTVERSSELVDVSQEEDAAKAVIKTSDGQFIEEKFSYIAGCDGAHSIVRKKANISFLGEAYKGSWMLLDCEIDSFNKEDIINIFATRYGSFAIAPIGKKIFRIAATRRIAGTNPDEDPTLAEFQMLVDSCLPEKVKLGEPKWITKYNLHHRIVNTFQNGRMLVAGDAAHIHSPVGAQGMNTGIQDAYNLGWKLALMQCVENSNDILNSYNAERNLVAKKVVKDTHKNTKIMALSNPLLIKSRNYMMQKLMSFGFVQRNFINNMAEINIRYEQSDIIREDWQDSPCHKLKRSIAVGKRNPNIKLSSWDKQETGGMDTLSRLKHLLLFIVNDCEKNFIRQQHEVLKPLLKEYQFFLEPHYIFTDTSFQGEWDGVKCWLAEKKSIKIYGVNKAAFYLIRPDGYIAYRNQPVSVEKLKRYLSIFKPKQLL